MSIFNFFRKDEFVDLSKESDETVESSMPQDTSTESINLNDPLEKKKRFVKRITEMIEKIENLSTKIYHIEQRLEVMEKKLRVNSFRSE